MLFLKFIQIISCYSVTTCSAFKSYSYSEYSVGSYGCGSSSQCFFRSIIFLLALILSSAHACIMLISRVTILVILGETVNLCTNRPERIYQALNFVPKFIYP